MGVTLPRTFRLGQVTMSPTGRESFCKGYSNECEIQKGLFVVHSSIWGFIKFCLPCVGTIKVWLEQRSQRERFQNEFLVPSLH